MAGEKGKQPIKISRTSELEFKIVCSSLGHAKYFENFITRVCQFPAEYYYLEDSPGLEPNRLEVTKDRF